MAVARDLDSKSRQGRKPARGYKVRLFDDDGRAALEEYHQRQLREEREHASDRAAADLRDLLADVDGLDEGPAPC
jgi:hypothetical protein